MYVYRDTVIVAAGGHRKKKMRDVPGRVNCAHPATAGRGFTAVAAQLAPEIVSSLWLIVFVAPRSVAAATVAWATAAGRR